jgi:hypothetical protein
MWKEGGVMSDNEPAFPVFDSDDNWQYRGMALRDYFAAKAMAGFCADPSVEWKHGREIETTLAKLAYDVADAMIQVRQQKKDEVV